MGVLLQGFDRFVDVPHIPEFDLTVVPAAGQVVLLVGIEVQVSHQLPVGIFNAVDLTVWEREREKQEHLEVSNERERERERRLT